MRLGIVSVLGVVVARLLTKGMSGFTQWFPHTEIDHGEIVRRSGMMLGYAMYTLIPGGFLYVLTGDLWAVLFASSGLATAAVYVQGARLLPGDKLFAGLTAEKFGRIANGLPVFALCFV